MFPPYKNISSKVLGNIVAVVSMSAAETWAAVFQLLHASDMETSVVLLKMNDPVIKSKTT